VTLGPLLAETSSALLAVQKAVRSPAQKRQIAAQLQQLLALTGRLVDADVERATPEYGAATVALARAQRALAAASDDLASVARAIEATAGAIDLLTRLAALAA